MSAYSTLYFSREKAIDKIKSSLDELDNKELASILDVILERALYNAIVVPGAIIDELYQG